MSKPNKSLYTSKERECVLREFKETKSLHLLTHDCCQYEFMKSLQSACNCEKWNIGMATTAPFQWYSVAIIHPGSDYGRPWTSLVFACFPSVYGENSEVLTYRLQIGGTDTSPTPELVLQQYAYWDGSHPDFERRKTERRDQLRHLFRKSNSSGGALTERVARKRGRYSSEIAVFSLNDARACELLTTHLPAIHMNFIQSVHGEMTP